MGISMESIRSRVKAKIDRIPASHLRAVYKFLEQAIKKGFLQEWAATFELLDNKRALRGIRRGLSELKRGKWVEFEKVRRNV